MGIIGSGGSIALLSGFQANLDAMSNVATTTTLTYGTEIFDVNGDYNDSTYTFTAPITGYYQFNVSARLEQVDVDSSWLNISLITDNRIYTSFLDPDGFAGDPSYFTLIISVCANMTAGHTAYVTFNYAGGAQQVDISAGAHSVFSGYLVGV